MPPLLISIIMATPFKPSNLSDVAVPADELLLNAGDRKTLPVFIPNNNLPINKKVPDDSNESSGGSGNNPAVDGSGTDLSPSPGVDGSDSNSTGFDLGNGHYTTEPNTALSAIFKELFGMLTFGSSHYSAFDMINGNSYLDVLSNVLTRVKKMMDDLDLDSDYAGAQLEFLEKVGNVAHSYLDSMFNQLLNYQSWYLQQEYNTPLNQLKRLEQAGLSSAFIFGGYSNTAGSVSSSGGSGSNPALASTSGAGQAVTQEHSSKRELAASLFGTMADTTVNLLNAGINSQKTLAEASNIRQLTPLQIQNAVRDFENKGILGQYMSTQAGIMESTDFRNWYDLQTKRAGDALDKAQTAYNSATSEQSAKRFGSYYVDEQVYTGRVIYRDGHQEFKDFTRNELEESVAKGGYTKNGGRIEGFDKFDVKAGFKNKFGADVGGKILGLGVSGKSDFQYGLDLAHQRGQSKSNYNEDGTNYNTGKVNLNEYGHYTDNGNSFQIGDTTFKINNKRRRIDSNEYKAFMQDAHDRLINAQKHYNSLTDDDKGFWLRTYDSYLKNYSEGIKNLFKSKFDANLYSSPEASQPQVLIGD